MQIIQLFKGHVLKAKSTVETVQQSQHVVMMRWKQRGSCNIFNSGVQ